MRIPPHLVRGHGAQASIEGRETPGTMARVRVSYAESRILIAWSQTTSDGSYKVMFTLFPNMDRLLVEIGDPPTSTDIVEVR
jgi:hypothetical protein